MKKIVSRLLDEMLFYFLLSYDVCHNFFVTYNFQGPSKACPKTIFFLVFMSAKKISHGKLRKLMKNITHNITQIEYDMHIYATKLQYLSSHFTLTSVASAKNEMEWSQCLNHFTSLLRKKRCFTNYLKLIRRL